MKEMKRFLAAGLSVGLLVSSLAGCGNSSSSTSGTSESESTGTSNESAYTAAGYTYDGDVCEEIFGLPADTIIGSINGENLTLLELAYWLTYDTNILAYYYYGSLDSITWDDAYSDEMTMEDYVKEDALAIAVNYWLIENKAEELGLELTEEQSAAVDETMQGYVDSFGETLWDNAVSDGTINEDDYDDDAKAEWIQAAGEDDIINEAAIYVTTVDYLRYMNEIYYLYNNIQDYYFAEGGEYEPTDEDVAQYAEDEGYVCAQSILFMSLEDEDGNTVDYADMDDDQKAELKAEAQAALDAILASDDPDATFEEYQVESDDTGSNTAGATYTFQDGDMVDEYYEAVTSLEVGDTCAELVESEDYGYFIVKRCAVSSDAIPVYYSSYGYSYTIEYLYINDAFGTMISDWTEDAEIETNELFDDISMSAFSINLLALEEALYPSDTTEETTETTTTAEE